MQVWLYGIPFYGAMIRTGIKCKKIILYGVSSIGIR